MATLTSCHAHPKTLAQVIHELLAAKTVANRRPRYLKGLKQYLGAFARGRESALITEIDAGQVEAWFASRREAPSTRSSNLGRLSALFAYAHRRGYVTENPVDRIETVFLEPKPPKIITPPEARMMLEHTRRHFPRFLPWLTLALFAGIRPEEMDRLEWRNVDLERGLVTIDAAASKVRRRRVMPVPEVAVAWLKLGGQLPLPHVSRRRYVRRLRDALGWPEWPQDVLRHTAASYLLAEHQDAGKVALWLGNSPKILLAHYQELVGRDVARQFYALLPLAPQMELTLWG